MDRWPHQVRGINETLGAIERGMRRICVCSPTGGGKTLLMQDLARHFLDKGQKAQLYTVRKMLLEQTSGVFMEAGLHHGVRAAGYKDEREYPFQISSIQTENSRVIRSRRWRPHEAGLVLVDEAHQQTGAVARKLLDMHWQAGAAIVGFTATPLDLKGMYEELIVAGTTSELRACGALVPCHHFGPDEPDLRKFKRLQTGKDLSENDNRTAMMRPGIFGRVLASFEKLNTQHKPTILFASGVPESIFFAEQFLAKGISAAHIDGENVWVNGTLYESSRTAREDVLAASKEGHIIVLCNRFVLREGINAPWLAHGIFATVFGSLQSYLEAGGRLLRAYPGLAHVTLQDHGGNWWRHGSLNADREWHLEDTSTTVVARREDRLRTKKEREPFRCPECAKIIERLRCDACGWEAKVWGRSRTVVGTNGELVEMHGDIFKPHRIDQRPVAVQDWERTFWRARHAGLTFRQAIGLYAKEHDWQFPPRNLALMPIEESDWHRKVKDVPFERLFPREQVAVAQQGRGLFDERGV
jgi:superfamily II DNA or RNA helicase